MFITFRDAVARRFSEMSNDDLFVVDADKDHLWQLYLNSFPEGTNPIFRERTEHDCQCCKQFIRKVGLVVDAEGHSMWRVDVPEPYRTVSQVLADFVESRPICDVFLHDERKVGLAENHQLLDDKSILQFEHFAVAIPELFRKKTSQIPTLLNEERTKAQTLFRAVSEISSEAVETVLELIAQNSLYRGQEFERKVLALQTEQRVKANREHHCWVHRNSPASGIRNSAIGTLLVDLSAGMDLDSAVTRYEKVVAPTNYRRPTALITPAMVRRAEETVQELGLESALQRRYAVLDDISVNNVLYANRALRKETSVFDSLAASLPDQKLSRVEDISLQDFLRLLPQIDEMEVFLENSHEANFVSLVAPVDPSAPNILQWNNNFSWTYNGAVTDSIKERVKAAGGNVEGILRCSLSWFNRDDLDIHVIEPDGNEICYASKVSPSSGILDVDMNVHTTVRNAVENITWTQRDRILEGRYKVIVDNFTPREAVDMGFEIEIEYANEIHKFAYDKKVDRVTVAVFDFSFRDGIKFISSLSSTTTPKEIWNLTTQKFHKVIALLNSPNHWDGQTIGNLHKFFILEDCRNPEGTRGLFNEFLRNDLHKHRKVFEVLGNRLRVPPSDRQLSGLGFSSTQRNSVTVRLSGSFTRALRVNL